MLYMKAKSLNKVTKESAMRNAQESADTNLLWAPVKPVVLLHPSTHGNAAVSHATACLHHSVYTEYNQLPTKHKSLEITSRYSTGSQKLHHCCPLANKVDNTWVQRSLGNPQSAPSCWGRSGPTHNTWFIQPQSAHPKCHLDNFIHFLRAHLTLMANRHTDRQACHATCVTIGHIPRYALQCGLKILS